MSQFYSLLVEKIEKNTSQSVILTLGYDSNLSNKFSFNSGQYLTVRHQAGSEDLRRCYSICVNEGSAALQIGIKKIQGGAFSCFANETLKIGDRLEVMPPAGKFTLSTQDEPRHVIVVAAGSGITPIISHIEKILSREKNSRVTLIYGNKTTSSIMFRERIEDLKNIYLKQLSVIHVLSSAPQDIELFSGRITANKFREIIKNWGQNHKIDQALLCGPEEMIMALKGELFEMGVREDRILYELFSTEKRKTGKANLLKEVIPEQIEATILLDGVAHKIAMVSGQSLLAAARENNLDAPFSCQAGICSSCRCKIIKGAGEMEVNHALEDYEVRAGYALSCQLHPTSNKITISYDEGH